MPGKKEGEKDWGKYTVSGRPAKPKMMDGERAWVSYPSDALSVVEFRYAISFISHEQARNNFERELKGITFEQLKNKGQLAWQKVMDQIKVEGGTFDLLIGCACIPYMHRNDGTSKRHLVNRQFFMFYSFNI